MLVYLLDELLVNICQFGVQCLYLAVEAGEGLLVWEFFVKVGDWVEV